MEKKARTHGNKIYKQLLLDPAKFEILNEIATDRGIKSSALIRQIVYEWIESQVDVSRFKEADALDNAVWRKSISNRIDGRKKKASRANKTVQSQSLVNEKTIEEKNENTGGVLSKIKDLLTISKG